MSISITMIGAGYVGLVSGSGFAELGAKVLCVEKDKEKLKELQQGALPIYEPGLLPLMQRHIAAGNLSFEQPSASAIAQADMVVLAVGTPNNVEREPDLQALWDALADIAGALSGYTMIVTKSTIPVGTSRKIDEFLRRRAPEVDFDVVYNPEFLREGMAVKDFMQPDRIIIGAEEQRAIERMDELYRPLKMKNYPVIHTGWETAEIIKYSANAILAIKIAFINEISDLCEQAGGNILQVSHALGQDARIAPGALQAGPGYGGSCLPKDSYSFLHTAKTRYDTQLTILRAAVQANEARGRAMVERIIGISGGSVGGARLCVLGGAFKENTDDVRESPALAIISGLLDAGANLVFYDPVAGKNLRAQEPRAELAESAIDALDGAQAAIVATRWPEFASLNLQVFSQKLAQPILIDLHSIYSAEAAKNVGLRYYGIGR